jgi:hypothetical protein
LSRFLGRSILIGLLALAGCQQSSGGPEDAGGLPPETDDGGPVSPLDGGAAHRDGGPRTDGGADAGSSVLPPDVVIVEVDAFTPSRGPVAGGTSVTLSGRGFIPGTTVTIGGVALVGMSIDGERTITGATPPGTAGVSPVLIANTGGTVEVPGGFTYVEDVAVQSVTPPSGPAAGGTDIVIGGTGFLQGSAVLIGARPAISVTVDSPLQIRAVTPPGSPGAAAVTVVNGNGQATLDAGFTYQPALALSGVLPAVGPVGGGNVVRVQGQGFDPTAQVFFGAVRAGMVGFTSATELSVTVPGATQAGTVDVAVTGALGSARLAGAYAYFDGSRSGLTLQAVAPNHGPAAGGTEVRLAGTGFDAGVTGVLVGGTAATGVVAESANILRILTPPGSPGAADIVVSANGGATAILTGAFTYEGSFSITSISPAAGPSVGGTDVEVRGEGFAPGVELFFGPMAAGAVRIIDDSTLHATTPPGGAGTVDVLVRLGDRQALRANGFFYFDTPRLFGVAPGRGAIAGGTLVTITGAGFTAASRPYFNGAPAVEVNIAGPSVLTARTPPGDVGLADVVMLGENGTAVLPGGYQYFDPSALYGGTWGDPVTGSVNVTVLNGNDGHRVPGAFATLSTSGITAYQGITDANGQITFSGPDLHGRQVVTAAKEGFTAASIVSFDAENVTLFISPLVSSASFGPGPTPGMVTGVIKSAFKGIPAAPDGYRKALIITTSMENRFTPNLGASLYYTDNGQDDRPYMLTTRTGNLAVYALVGYLSDDTTDFIPLNMGIRRYLFMPDGGMLTGIDITMDFSLYETLDAPLTHAPPLSATGPNSYRMRVYLELGIDGTVFFYRMEESRNAPHLRQEHLPLLIGPFQGASYTAIAGAYTVDSNGGESSPLSIYLRQGVTDLSSPIEFGPMMGIPVPVSPRQDEFLTQNRFLWTLDQPPAADFTLMYLLEATSAGFIEIWQMIVPGTVKEMDVPDLIAAAGLTGIPHNNYFYWILLPAHGSAFNIDAFDYRAFNSGDWSTYAVAPSIFLTP